MIVPYLVATIILVGHVFAADLARTFPIPCDGSDTGEATTVVTIPANEKVDVFHYRSTSLASIIEFCVREPGGNWTLVASHGTDEGSWSILQSWIFPKIVEIKTRAYANSGGTLYPFKYQTRTETSYGYSFSWSDTDANNQDDQIVYCFGGRDHCPTSRRVDFP